MQSGGNRTIMIGCAVLLVLACVCVAIWGGVVYVMGPDKVLALVGLGAQAQAAKLAPTNAPFFMAVDISPGQVLNFQKVWSAFDTSSPRAKQSTDDVKKQFRDQFNCDFDADILPWAGPDVALFLTDTRNLAPAPSSRGGATTPNFVMAIGARDQAKANAALQKCVPKNQTARAETYKNINLKIYNESALAVVANYLLVSATVDAMKAAIDTQASGAGASLESNARYKNALANLPASRAVTYYVDVNPLSKTYLQSQPGIQPQALSQLDAYQAVAGSLAFADNGVKLDTVLTFDPAKLPECTRTLIKQQSTPTKVYDALPASTTGVVAATNWKDLWNCSLSMMDTTSRKQVQDSFDQIKRQTGIDINADVFDVLTGEYAVAVTPARPIAPNSPGLGIMLLVETKDQGAMNAKLDKIASALAKQGMPPLKDQPIKGVTFKTASLGSPNDRNAPSAGYGFTGGFLLLGGPLDALETMMDAPSSPLKKEPAYATVYTALGQTNPLLYVNMSSVNTLIASTMTGSARTNYENEVTPWLKPIKAIGISSKTPKPEVTLSSLFIYIAK